MVHSLSLHEAVQSCTVFVFVRLFNCVAPNVNFFRHSTKRDAHTIMNEKQLQIPKNISAVYF